MDTKKTSKISSVGLPPPKGHYRIAFLSEKNPQDRRTWSGTPYGIFFAFKHLGYDVEWIAPRKGFFSIILFLVKCVDGFFQRALRLNCAIRRWPICAKMSASRFEIKDSQYDIALSVGLTLCAFYRTRLPIISVIDATFDCFDGYYEKAALPIFSSLADSSEKKSAERANIIIAASQWCKDSLKEHYGVPENKIRLFRLGANISKASPGNVDFPQKNEELKMLFIGLDTKRKGLRTAIETGEILRRNYRRNVTLDVIGTDRAEYSEHLPFVKFHGKLNKNLPEEMSRFEKIVASAHIFILPTRAECAGMVFSEAAAYGLPVFSYDTGGVGSYVENGGNGVLLPRTVGAEEFSKKILECWDFGKFPEYSKRGKILFSE